VDVSVTMVGEAPQLAVLRPIGEIDTLGAADLDASVQRVIERGHLRLILDFAEVTYLNSAGVGAVAMALKRARGRGGDVALAALNDRPRRAIELVRLHTVMVLAETVEEAAETLSVAAPADGPLCD
jgi:anti-anti-sigma factor